MISKAYYICLKSSELRVKFVNEQVKKFQSIGRFPVEVFNAIEGPSIDCQKMRDDGLVEKDTWHNRDLTPGELGCTLSHRAIWEKVLFGDKIMILEDDCELVDGWYPRLIEVATKVLFCDLFVLASQHKTWPENRTKVKDDVYRSKRESGGTSGYIINQLAAKELLHESKVIKYATDGIVGNVSERVATYITEPQLGFAQNFPSVIDPFGARTYRAN